MTTPHSAQPSVSFGQAIDWYLKGFTDVATASTFTAKLLNELAPGGRYLDCAVGTGLVALPIRLANHSLVCTDASHEMLQQFRRNSRNAGLLVQGLRLQWRSLRDEFPETFDVVTCTGNSLPYANSWDTEHAGLHDDALDTLVTEVRGMYGALRPGGSLYIDCAFDSGNSAQVRRQQTLVASAERVTIEERLSVEGSQRRWDLSVSEGGTWTEYTRYSTAISEAQLMDVLRSAGFFRVRPVEGGVLREHYRAFLAEKHS